MRSSSVEAKLSLAESFVELAETLPLENITINMIVEQVGKHRKTFYYHFADKNELIAWLFRYELACELKRIFQPEQLIYESAQGSFPEFPYYARNIGDLDRIYNAPFFDGMYRCFERRRNYYRKVFSHLGPGTLEHYLLDLYSPAIADDVRYLIMRKLHEQNVILRKDVIDRIDRGYSIDFLAEFFTGAFVSRYVMRLNYASTGRTAGDIQPFENIIHDSLGWVIHQEVMRVVSALSAESSEGPAKS